jgi:hypothetical protein
MSMIWFGLARIDNLYLIRRGIRNKLPTLSNCLLVNLLTYIELGIVHLLCAVQVATSRHQPLHTSSNQKSSNLGVVFFHTFVYAKFHVNTSHIGYREYCICNCWKPFGSYITWSMAYHKEEMIVIEIYHPTLIMAFCIRIRIVNTTHALHVWSLWSNTLPKFAKVIPPLSICCQVCIMRYNLWGYLVIVANLDYCIPVYSSCLHHGVCTPATICPDHFVD